MRARILSLALGLALATAAHAEGERPLRLIGEAAGPDGPRTFVIDAMLEPGDGPYRTSASGWFAFLDGSGSGELSGDCVEAHCALTVSTDDGDVAIIGDLASPAPAKARLRSGEDAPEAVVNVRLFADEVPGLGRLAARDSITAPELADLLVWCGASYGFTNDFDPDPIGDMERDALVIWQGQNERPATGLLTVEDLAALRAAAAAAKAKAQWTPVSGQGWSAGYPAAVLKPAAGAKTEQRFVSPNGKASLSILALPPLDGEAWDALVERETADQPDRERHGYTRVNDEFEITYEQAAATTFVTYHRREAGVFRLTLTYPTANNETWAETEAVLSREFKAPR
ncbi:MAG: hypothetical protein ACXW3D_11215 [Caulobacteraceae bacterium]